MSSEGPASHFIVLPGGGYAAYADNEGQPIVDWLGSLGISASVLRYPLNAPHPLPLNAVRSEVRRLRAAGIKRVGAVGFSAGGHLAGHAALSDASQPPRPPDRAGRGRIAGATAEDPYVPVEHSYRLAAALAAQNVPHAVHIFSKGPHSLGLARGAGEASAWINLAAAWLTDRLAL